MIHELKTWPEAFQALLEQRKRFEWRRDDRDPPFQEGDYLHLLEWIPVPGTESGRFSGRIVSARIGYILRAPKFNVPTGYAVLSLDEITSDPEDYECG